MESKNNHKDYYEYDEVNFKDLIIAIINERRTIAIITFAALLLSTFYTFFIIDPIYEATSELMIKAPTPVETRYGTYTFPSENINDYIQYIYSNEIIDRVIKKNNLGVDRSSFKKMVKVKFDAKAESNRFEVTISNTDPILAKSINDDLITQYVQSLRVTYKKNALEHFINAFEINMDSLQQSIDQLEAVSKETQELMDTMEPIYTLQKALFADPKTAAAYADTLNLKLSDLSEHVMVEEYINENYFSLQNKVVDYKTQLIGYRESLMKQKRLYEELVREKEQTNQSESMEKITNGRLDVFSTNLSVVSPAYTPEKAISPRKAYNIALGLILGLITGVLIALFKSYWKSN